MALAHNLTHTRTCSQIRSQNFRTGPLSGGKIVSREVGTTNLCLTASPEYTLEIQPCSSNDNQIWALDESTGQLSLVSTDLCLFMPAPPPVSLYAKPLTAAAGGHGQPIAVAVLNRGDTGVGGQTIDLALFGFAPAQSVKVRDIWANTDSQAVTGNFTTRAIDSHETLLLVLTPQ